LPTTIRHRPFAFSLCRKSPSGGWLRHFVAFPSLFDSGTHRSDWLGLRGIGVEVGPFITISLQVEKLFLSVA
jgi:hypothetical protein